LLAREVEAFRGAHSFRASEFADVAASLATEAEEEMNAGKLDLASWDGLNAQAMAGEARYEAALISRRRRVKTPFMGFVSWPARELRIRPSPAEARRHRQSG